MMINDADLQPTDDCSRSDYSRSEENYFQTIFRSDCHFSLLVHQTKRQFEDVTEKSLDVL